MEIISQSFLLVALTEMGDKTQLLAFILALQFRRPWTVFLGILIATILNHLAAAYLGSLLGDTWLDNPWLQYGLALLFFAFAIWILIPDKEEGLENYKTYKSALLTTIISFFLAEMGDKTQLSTFALAARYHEVFLVTLGTTLGMLFSDGLAIYFGKSIQEKIPMKYVRFAAAFIYVLFALGILLRK